MSKYERIMYWSDTDDKWIVEIPELSGCIADGNTPVEAIENSEIVIKDWIETAKELGKEIPAYKGRLLFS